METWRICWREGIVPSLTRRHLEALKEALETDDPRLIQGLTSLPVGDAAQGLAASAACALGFCGWRGDGLPTVSEVEEFFGRVSLECCERLRQEAVVRWFTNWFDETPRDEMRPALLAEVELALEVVHAHQA